MCQGGCGQIRSHDNHMINTQILMNVKLSLYAPLVLIVKILQAHMSVKVGVAYMVTMVTYHVHTACHVSCQLSCDGAGPEGCDECKGGYRMEENICVGE